MRLLRLTDLSFAVLFIVFPLALFGQDYTGWSAKEAGRIGSAMTASGHVDGTGGWRVNTTNKATSYQFRATWLTPAVIKATARLEQFRQRLSNDETRTLVEEAENAGPTVFLIELDAIEGSGVIPADWQAFLQSAKLPEGSEGSMKGQSTPELWRLKGLAGTKEKDYKYERFWVVFPLTRKDGQPLFSVETEAELIIRVNSKEGKVSFRIPADVLEKSRRLSKTMP